MSSFYWSVNPRYSPGSGAWVDPDTAARVLYQEWEGVEWACSGRLGEDTAEKALADDLSGIVTARDERGARITDVYDLITGKAERHIFKDGIFKRKLPLHEWDAQHTIEALREQCAASLRAQRASWMAQQGHATVSRKRSA
jgi:hypothetical protein